MQATLCLTNSRPPAVSLHRPPPSLHHLAGNHLAVRRTSSFYNCDLRSTVKARTLSAISDSRAPNFSYCDLRFTAKARTLSAISDHHASNFSYCDLRSTAKARTLSAISYPRAPNFSYGDLRSTAKARTLSAISDCWASDFSYGDLQSTVKARQLSAISDPRAPNFSYGDLRSTAKARTFSAISDLRASNFSYGDLRYTAKAQTFSAIFDRCASNFSYGDLRSKVRILSAISDRKNRNNKGLASMAGAAVVAVALACAAWSRSGGAALAASWYSVPIQGGGDREQGEPKRREKQQIAAEVIGEMFSRKDLPNKFNKITPNYPKIKEYFENHLRLSDQACDTLINKWKEIKPGPDQIDIGLLLVDVCIIKGNVAGANELLKEILKTASESDLRPVIRRTVVNMIKDYEKKKEMEKKIEWERFAKKMQEIADSPFADEPDEDL